MFSVEYLRMGEEELGRAEATFGMKRLIEMCREGEAADALKCFFL